MLLRCAIATASLSVAMISLSHADPPKEPTFSEYALAPETGDEAAFTADLLIDWLRMSRDETYWDEHEERDEARDKPGYKPTFTKEHLALAEAKLPGDDWISLQRVGLKRTIKDITPLRYAKRLEGLAAGDNEISDLSPLKDLPELRRLHLNDNKIRDLAPLAGCKKLAELHLSDNPIADFSPIAQLTSLRELSISWDQLPAFRKAGKFPTLKKLVVWFAYNGKSDPVPLTSLEQLPEMPALATLEGIHSKNLVGLQRFTALRNLTVDLEGGNGAVEALATLPALTHLHINGDKVGDLAPLAKLTSLRSLWIVVKTAPPSLEPLAKLEMLREVHILVDRKEMPGLERIRARMLPWDYEFRAKKPRYTPALEIVVVDDAGFDALDTKPPQGTVDPDGDPDLLESELGWLDGKLRRVFGKNLRPDEDYAIPDTSFWPVCRWREVVLLTDKANPELPKIVGSIQKILSAAKNDWIIHFEADEQYKFWIYPDKIVVPRKHEAVVKRLLGK